MAGNQNSGGKRVGAGRKKKPLADKITEGEKSFTDSKSIVTTKLQKVVTSGMLIEKDLYLEKILTHTTDWLNQRKCLELISPILLERYAISVLRWVQCENKLSEQGYIGTHPTTGADIASPFVSMSQNYMNQINRLWGEIDQIVKENCTEVHGDKDDPMEKFFKLRL